MSVYIYIYRTFNIFVCYEKALGGPKLSNGKAMDAAHRRLVLEKGLNDTHFDAVAKHLNSTLEELGANPVDIQPVTGAVDGMRDQVLCRGAFAIKPKTLYEKLGGEPALDKAVTIFYSRVLADPSINHFFAAMNMKVQHRKQKAFFVHGFGWTKRVHRKEHGRRSSPLGQGKRLERCTL